jgi:formylglycine-generating enzyme required for sulfatase activity
MTPQRRQGDRMKSGRTKAAMFGLAVVGALLTACGPRPEETAQSPVEASPEPPPPVEGMVWIPGGRFLMGSYSGMPNEQPVHEVALVGFYLDATEVTNAQFRRFVEATGYVTMAERPMTEAELSQIPPDRRPEGPVRFGSILFQKTEGPVPLDQPVWWKMEFEANWKQPAGPGSNLDGKDQHPVVCVTHEDAAAYAKWAGKRLPTEAEWEFAARGGLEGKKYEWGNAPLPAEKGSRPEDWPCNLWQGNFPYQDLGTDGYAGTSPVKSYRPNGYGLHDMTGNVWELCADFFAADAYATSEAVNPRGPSAPRGAQSGADVRVMRGASWRIHRSYGPSPAPGAPPILEYRVATRNEAAADTATNDVGFRCAKDR